MFNIPAADSFTLIFIELTVGLLIGVILGNVARLLRQPLILAYILTGILVSVFGFAQLSTREALPLFASLGVAFLLFLVGIELRIADLKRVGKSALYTGLGQLAFTSVVGFFLLRLLGFDAVTSLYVSFALTFSSTIIIVKLLTEKKDLNSLYGKIAVGFLLIQDLAAIFALMILSGFQTGAANLPSLMSLAGVLVKGLFLFGLVFLLGKFVLPSLFHLAAVSTELLLITAISWCFILAGFAKIIGFSFEIGAFLAGVAIASLPFRLQILATVRPLRDFFIVIFFIVLGMGITIGHLQAIIWPTIVLSLFILIGNPLIVMAIMGFLGHKKRTSFLASVTVAQISEFSLILVAVGEKLGHLTPEVVSMVALIGVITITVSSYMILYSNSLYEKLSPFIGFFERRSTQEASVKTEGLEGHIVLLGCEQIGRDLLDFFKAKNVPRSKLLIVDFNPSIVDTLTAEGYQVVYGDIADTELLEELHLNKAVLIISTIPDINLTLLGFVRRKGFNGPIIVTAYWAHDAIKLYEAGADYVIVPELIGGDHTARILSDHWLDLAGLKKVKETNLARLIEISRSLAKNL